MNLIHFSAHEGLPLGVISRRQKPDGATKPEGLWLSVEGNGDGWSDWCRGEEFRLDQLAVAHRVTLAEAADILYLSTAEQIDEFTLTYSRTDGPSWLTRSERIGYRIDWRAVAAKHQGIIISPYIWERRLTLHTHWYYGWDCASGCIWDRAAIASVEVAADCLVANGGAP